MCDDIDSRWDSDYLFSGTDDPYLAPMGSLVQWKHGGHIHALAYELRARSGEFCHPSYAIPMRHMMRQVLEENDLADAMGLVESKSSLLGVEFADRVPA